MIVRISGEGQYRLADSETDRLNELERAVLAAVEGGDEDPAYTIMRKAIAGAAQDPELLAEAVAMKLDMAYRGPEHLERLITHLYATSPEGEPGAVLTVVERSFDAQLTSNGTDGKWVVEELSLPVQRAPIWIGIHNPGHAAETGRGDDPRLWATSNDSGSVFQRDADPNTPRSATHIPRTPVVRLEVEPVAAAE